MKRNSASNDLQQMHEHHQHDESATSARRRIDEPSSSLGRPPLQGLAENEPTLSGGGCFARILSTLSPRKRKAIVTAGDGVGRQGGRGHGGAGGSHQSHNKLRRLVTRSSSSPELLPPASAFTATGHLGNAVPIPDATSPDTETSNATEKDDEYDAKAAKAAAKEYARLMANDRREKAEAEKARRAEAKEKARADKELAKDLKEMKRATVQGVRAVLGHYPDDDHRAPHDDDDNKGHHHTHHPWQFRYHGVDEKLYRAFLDSNLAPSASSAPGSLELDVPGFLELLDGAHFSKKLRSGAKVTVVDSVHISFVPIGLGPESPGTVTMTGSLGQYS